LVKKAVENRPAMADRRECAGVVLPIGQQKFPSGEQNGRNEIARPCNRLIPPIKGGRNEEPEE